MTLCFSRCAVGATIEESTDFRYLYENHENFSLLPTFYVIYGPKACIELSILQDEVSGSLDLTRVNVHLLTL